MKQIIYINGDATRPIGEGDKIIAHVCNNIGAWGAGFVLSLSERWPLPEQKYREWYKHPYSEKECFGLGNNLIVQVELNISICNMIAQEGIRSKHNAPPIRYDHLEVCLLKLGNGILINNFSVHMPRIGCGLAGGRWDTIEPIIIKTLCNRDITVVVYDWR